MNLLRLAIIGVAAAPALGQIEATVYDVGVPADSGGVWASGGCVAYDDVTLGGPGSAGAVDVVALSIAVIVPAAPAPPGNVLYARVSFFPGHACGTSPPYSGAAVVTSTGPLFLNDFGVIQNVPRTPLSVRLDDSNVFGSGDRTVGVLVELFLDAAMTQYATDFQLARRANMPTSGDRIVFPVGSSDSASWFSISPPQLNTPSCTPGGNRTLYLALHASYSCGTADFDGDGDTGTDADISAFFACLAGNCCATCWPGGSDFDTDGDSGTDGDIEAFFRVLAGGSC